MNAKALVAIIAKKKVIFDLKDQDIARMIAVSYPTYRGRKTEPLSFTLGEVNNIMRVLKFTEDEKKEVFLQ